MEGARKLSNALVSAVFALCLFPKAQITAQDEIDSVVGNSRSPSWEDLDEGRLPYVSALAKEVLRWRPVVEFACTTLSTRDAKIRDFLIPQGTQIVCNLWAIHRNARKFPEADVLRPERFLEYTGDGRLNLNCLNGGENYAFGWGLQRCSGQAIAEQSLLSVLARLLWAYRVEPGLDEPVSTREMP